MQIILRARRDRARQETTMNIIPLTLAALAALPLLASPADARHRRGYDDGGSVTADSRHGNGSITGAIRPGRYTWEVQLPSGSWTSCRRSCEETLRVQTIDLFETNDNMVGYGTLHNQCGIFGCLELSYPR
jgi:hypothetical protein